MAGQRGRLVADALLDVAVGGEHVDVVVERARRPAAASGSNRPRSRRAAMAMPTALPMPWPSGPVVVSTPGVWPCSGWPGVRLPQVPVAPRGRPGSARSRTGRAGCRASGWSARRRARTGRGRASAGRPGRAAGSAGRAGRPRAPGSSRCRGGPSRPSRRRPWPGPGSGRRPWRRPATTQARDAADPAADAPGCSPRSGLPLVPNDTRPTLSRRRSVLTGPSVNRR